MPEVKIKPPEIGARKLLEGVRRSRGFYIYGVQNPKVSPTEAAVSQADAWHAKVSACLLYTSPSPRDLSTSRMPSSA